MYTEGRARNQNLRFSAHAKRSFLGPPVAVLVNADSYGTAELITGALQDWGRAIAVGRSTAGGGSIQTLIPLSDGSFLRLTTAPM